MTGESTTPSIWHGIPVSPGIQIGKLYIYDPAQTTISRRFIRRGEIEQEKTRLADAIAKAKESLLDLRGKVVQSLDEAHASIFDPQLMLLEDPLLLDRTYERIEQQQQNAAMAFTSVVQQFADQFASLTTDSYIAGRKVDIMDLGKRVSQLLASADPETTNSLQFTEDVIILASDMSPSDTAQMDHQHVKGFATELGGPTSHSAILAKALEIPCVVGLGRVLQDARPGQVAIIDGYEGQIVLDPDQRELARAKSRRRRHLAYERDLQKLRTLSAETVDGFRVELAANVELPIEIPHVLAHGAEGVGLFRTEFQYLERAGLPTEEDLFIVYKKVVESVAPHPVVFRTIDLGGDKFLSTLQTAREVNPFMGLRAIRLCLAHPGVFKTQLRALLRASAFGNARIMFPMISSVREVLQAKAILDEIRDDLRREGRPFNEEIQIGIMIEIPSAAVCADSLAREVDFFSIGTNDLIQYTLAVDRGNEQVASLYDPFHPAILRLIRTTIDAAHRQGIWVGLCGEIAANPLCALLLVGLGINELSMGALAIPEIKRLIRGIRLADARRICEEIYSLRTSSDIHAYVREAYRSIQRQRRKSPVVGTS
ncbi:phosphoenolpyruvate--protein phosphotransferase [bacterium]|nr:phosphoenolpyruvate--protein phosphotransferase [bacterium]